MSVKTVAIIGSCATRDNFNSKFNPDYSKHFKVVVSQNQSSIISLASNPVEVDYKKIDCFSDSETYKFRDVRSDLSKELFTHIYKLKPDIIVIDFLADVHLGVIKLSDNQYITNNRWKLHQTKYFESIKKSKDIKFLNINNSEYLELWKKSFDELMKFIKLVNSECVVILHKARNAKYMIDESGRSVLMSESGRMMKVDVDRLNEVWEQMDNYALAKHKLRYIDVFDDTIKSTVDHPWGPFYAHYEMGYYHNFLNELIRITKAKESFFKKLIAK